MNESEKLIYEISKGKNLNFEESKTIFLNIMSGNLKEDEEIDAVAGSWEWMQQTVTVSEQDITVNEETITMPGTTFVNLPDTDNFRLLTFNEEKTFIMSGKMNGVDYLSTGIWSKSDSQIVISEESFGTADNLTDYDSVITMTYDYSLIIDTSLGIPGLLMRISASKTELL